MQFDQATLSTLATKAILDSMTQEHKDQLLARAVAGLFEPNTPNGYSTDKRTKFEAAFDDALGFAVQRIMRELVAEERFQAAIRPLIEAAVEKALLGENRDRLASVFEQAIDAGLMKLRGH